MTSFFKQQKKQDPYTESIARTLNNINKKVTPSEIARYLKVHPNTVKERIKAMEKKGLVSCKKEGNRTYCERIKKINID